MECAILLLFWVIGVEEFGLDLSAFVNVSTTIDVSCLNNFEDLVSALTNNIHDHLIIQIIRISPCGSYIEDLILIQFFAKETGFENDFNCK